MDLYEIYIPSYFHIYIRDNYSFYCSMDGNDLCYEVVRRAISGFVYSEAVARWEIKYEKETYLLRYSVDNRNGNEQVFILVLTKNYQYQMCELNFSLNKKNRLFNVHSDWY